MKSNDYKVVYTNTGTKIYDKTGNLVKTIPPVTSGAPVKAVYKTYEKSENGSTKVTTTEIHKSEIFHAPTNLSSTLAELELANTAASEETVKHLGELHHSEQTE